MARHEYEPCALDDIPDDVRFDVPERYQGQIVEVAYGGYDRAGNDLGDPYMRRTDRSDNTVTYYRLRSGSSRCRMVSRRRPRWRYAVVTPSVDGRPKHDSAGTIEAVGSLEAMQEIAREEGIETTSRATSWKYWPTGGMLEHDTPTGPLLVVVVIDRGPAA